MAYDPSALRLVQAVEAAEYAFWSVIADKYPECTTGDLDPMTAIRLTNRMQEAAAAWVHYNTNWAWWRLGLLASLVAATAHFTHETRQLLRDLA